MPGRVNLVGSSAWSPRAAHRDADIAAMLRIDGAARRRPPLTRQEAERCRRETARHAIVLDDGMFVGGFAIFSRVRREVATLDRLVVHPALRRRGLGRLLMAAVATSCAVPRGPKRLRADVREHDDAALAFLKACGWLGNGVLFDHFREPTEDAWRLEFQLGLACPFAGPCV